MAVRSLTRFERLPKGEASDVWLTPHQILFSLGEFDLDPCAAPYPRPWPTAKHHICPPENGLEIPWSGRVWLNPPYGYEAKMWLRRMAEHKNGIAFLFTRTCTSAWEKYVWPHAKALLFVHGRVTFYLPNAMRTTRSPAPSVLVAYSPRDAEILKSCAVAGAYVKVEDR